MIRKKENYGDAVLVPAEQHIGMGQDARAEETLSARDRCGSTLKLLEHFVAGDVSVHSQHIENFVADLRGRIRGS